MEQLYKNWVEAGFKSIAICEHLAKNANLECPYCFAIVKDNKWFDHLKALHAHLIMTHRFSKEKINQNLYGEE